jgi:DNA primase
LAQTGVLGAFDADDAGQRAAVSAYHRLAEHTTAIAALALPAGQDPAQILDDCGPASLREALADRRHPLADLVIDAEIGKWTRWLSYAEGQIAALRAIAPVIAAMPAPDVARQAGRLATRLHLDHAIVTEAITDALTVRASAEGRPVSRLAEPTRCAAASGRAPTLEFPAGLPLGTAPAPGRPASRSQKPGGSAGEQAGLRTGRISG